MGLCVNSCVSWSSYMCLCVNSCVSWSSYHKGGLASSDYEGTVTLWDANTGTRVKMFQVSAEMLILYFLYKMLYIT